jgi:hypothetical protein
MALSAQQNYLLQRLPSKYSRKSISKVKPPAVVKAEKLIEEYNEKVKHDSKLENAEFDKDYKAAQEAIYFKPIDAALILVKKLEEKYNA